MSNGTIVYPVLLRVLIIAFVSSPISCDVRSSSRSFRRRVLIITGAMHRDPTKGLKA
jgi:hypothetical protein